MNHIRLAITHRLLFKLLLGLAITSLLLGLGMIFAPDVFSSHDSASLRGIVPLELWGGLWTLSAWFILMGLYRLPYLLVRMGLVGLSTLYAMASVGLLTYQLSHHPVINISGVPILLALAYFSFAMIKEPPINPETAITNKHDETE